MEGSFLPAPLTTYKCPLSTQSAWARPNRPRLKPIAGMWMSPAPQGPLPPRRPMPRYSTLRKYSMRFLKILQRSVLKKSRDAFVGTPNNYLCIKTYSNVRPSIRHRGLLTEGTSCAVARCQNCTGVIYNTILIEPIRHHVTKGESVGDLLPRRGVPCL